MYDNDDKFLLYVLFSIPMFILGLFFLHVIKNGNTIGPWIMIISFGINILLGIIYFIFTKLF